MSHFIICSYCGTSLGIPKGHASTQLEQPRGLFGRNPHGNRHSRHQYREDCTATKTVGENTHRDAGKRPEEHWNRNEQCGLRSRQVKGLAEVGCEGRNQPPGREADHKRDRPECHVATVAHIPSLISQVYSLLDRSAVTEVTAIAREQNYPGFQEHGDAKLRRGALSGNAASRFGHAAKEETG
jgi:hypothetical protein